MFTPAEVAEFRADARARMGAENGGATGNIRRRSPNPVRNPTTGLLGPGWDVVYSELPGRLDGAEQTRTVTVGGVATEQSVTLLHLPWDTRDLLDGDLYEITDGDWAGNVLRIIETPKRDQKTARRVPVVDEEKPEEWL